MKEFVNDYVDEFYLDGAVHFNDNRYKECKDFCISFKKYDTGCANPVQSDAGRRNH